MCGIVAVINKKYINPEDLNDSMKALRHRGPDDEGGIFYEMGNDTVQIVGGEDTPRELHLSIGYNPNGKWNLFLGHRRLSIIDLSVAGHQPMSYLKERYWITFNGEIYNYIEIRDELEKFGYEFHSASDTEVILASYSQWGENAINKFTGMFAFVIFDRIEKSIIISRDQFGIKPLYYHVSEHGIIISSEIKSLLKFSLINRSIDKSYLSTYFRYGIANGQDRTIFSEIKEFPPGTYAKVNILAYDVINPVSYWSPEGIPKFRGNYHDASNCVREAFFNSIKLHLRSDAPIGTCLSGGLDSTAIIAAIRHLGYDREIYTFSYIEKNSVFDEEPFVDLVSKKFDTKSKKIFIQSSDLLHDIDSLILAQGVPFLGTSIYAQYKVFAAAQQEGVKVLLDGQGSDEIFGGYYTALSSAIAERFLSGRFFGIFKLINRLSLLRKQSKLKLLGSAASRVFPSDFTARIRARIDYHKLNIMLDSEYIANANSKPYYYDVGKTVHEELLCEIRMKTLPALLHYEDHNSMNFSIESRVPFCNIELANLALSLPSEFLITDNGETKSVLRSALRDIIPNEVLRRPKMGFNTPETDWMQGMKPWISDILNSEYTKNIPILNKKFNIHKYTSSNNNALWRLLNVVRWGQLNQVVW